MAKEKQNKVQEESLRGTTGQMDFASLWAPANNRIEAQGWWSAEQASGDRNSGTKGVRV